MDDSPPKEHAAKERLMIAEAVPQDDPDFQNIPPPDVQDLPSPKVEDAPSSEQHTATSDEERTQINDPENEVRPPVWGLFMGQPPVVQMDLESEIPEGTGRYQRSDPALLKHLDQLSRNQLHILELLERRADPTLLEMLEISEGLWGDPEYAWEVLDNVLMPYRNDSIGRAFLNDLAPSGRAKCLAPRRARRGYGTSVHPEDDGGGVTSNLMHALRTFEKFLASSEGLLGSGTSSFRSSGTTVGWRSREAAVIQARDMWSFMWEPSKDRVFRMFGNIANVTFAQPNRRIAGNPFKYVKQEAALGEIRKDSSRKSVRGMICQFSVNPSYSALDLETIADITCLTKRGDPSDLVNSRFVEAYKDDWRDQEATENCHSRDFWTPGHSKTEENPLIYVCATYNHSMRSYTTISRDYQPMGGNPDDLPGLRCSRGRVTLQSFFEDQIVTLVERRYSTFLSIYPVQRPTGHFVLVSVTDSRATQPDFWNEWPDMNASGRAPWGTDSVLPAGPFTGISMFQLQLCSFIQSWEKDWNKAISVIDSVVSVKITEPNGDSKMEQIAASHGSKCSMLYLTVLQTISTFCYALQDAETSLEQLSRHMPTELDVANWYHEPGSDLEGAQKVLEYNWTVVKKRQRDAVGRLLLRMERLREEVKTMREAVLLAQQMKAAGKGTNSDKYLLTLTAATILLLPPIFVSTFFGVGILFSYSRTATSKTVFWTVFGAILGLAYLLTGSLILATSSTNVGENLANRAAKVFRRPQNRMVSHHGRSKATHDSLSLKKDHSAGYRYEPDSLI